MAARYRRPAPTGSSPESSPEPSKPLKEAAESSQPGLSILDILRVLGGILLLSSGISYLSTSGESMTWGYNPWWTRAREWKALLTLVLSPLISPPYPRKSPATANPRRLHRIAPSISPMRSC